MQKNLTRFLCFASLLVLPAAALAQSPYGDPSYGMGDEGGDVSWQSQPPPPDSYDNEAYDDGYGGFQPAPTDMTPPVAPNTPVNFAMFQGSLSRYGSWVYLPGVGRAWRPYEQVVGAGFVPYATGGRWTYTPAGWSFQSQWPFGWATFHYGRWLLSSPYGWVWVPGFTWAPAWVDWRYSDGYVAWTPLPPVGHQIPFGYAASGWNFVHRYYFGRPYVNRYFVPPDYRRSPRWWHRAYAPSGVRPPPTRYSGRGPAWRDTRHDNHPPSAPPSRPPPPGRPPAPPPPGRPGYATPPPPGRSGDHFAPPPRGESRPPPPTPAGPPPGRSPAPPPARPPAPPPSSRPTFQAPPPAPRPPPASPSHQNGPPGGHSATPRGDIGVPRPGAPTLTRGPSFPGTSPRAATVARTPPPSIARAAPPPRGNASPPARGAPHGGARR